MSDRPPTPASVVVLTTLVALGVCAIAAAAMAPAIFGSLGAWLVLAAGVVVLSASFAALWSTLSGRDHGL